MHFALPPVTHTESGKIRRIGFELKYSGLTLEQTAALVKRVVGGTIQRDNEFRLQIMDTDWGDFTIELDSRLIREARYAKFLRDLGIKIKHPKRLAPLKDILTKVGDYFVPFELITPPLPLDQLQVMEDLRNQLQRHGAEGTAQSALYAFGLHINIETPEINGATILRYFQSFLLLSDWLFQQAEVNTSRKLSMFIKDFTTGYRKRVLDPSYNPDQTTLINDYLAANPSRNRVLDLLPLFATMSPQVAREYRTQKVQARPAFHYRLPNSLVSNSSWSIASEWDLWLQVERLAADHENLKQLLRRYHRLRSGFVFRFKKKWQREIAGWLQNAANR